MLHPDSSIKAVSLYDADLYIFAEGAAPEREYILEIFFGSEALGSHPTDGVSLIHPCASREEGQALVDRLLAGEYIPELEKADS